MSASIERTPEVVAVINTSPDVVDMLRLTLEQAGYVVVTALTFEIREGEVDLDRFMAQHAPKVVIYDIAPPYDNNWRLFQHIRAMPAMSHCHFVLTSTNARHVDHLTRGSDERIYEIVGKPVDLDAIVGAVHEAMRARPTR